MVNRIVSRGTFLFALPSRYPLDVVELIPRDFLVTVSVAGIPLANISLFAFNPVVDWLSEGCEVEESVGEVIGRYRETYSSGKDAYGSQQGRLRSFLLPLKGKVLRVRGIIHQHKLYLML